MRFIWILVGLALVACGGERAVKGAQDTAAPANEASTPGQWFVSAANPHATEAGAAVLRKGGSAVDAAIAVQSVLGLVEPQSSGLGGGAFLIHYDPQTGVLETYNGREMAPSAATPDRFLKPDGAPMKFYDAVVGGLSVGVPGAVKMLEMAHQDHGDLPWAENFSAAIALSEEGFDVSPRLNMLLSRIPRLKQLPAAATYFYEEDGSPKAVGTSLKNPAYGNTLRAVAEGGANAFYTGPVAAEIVAAVTGAPNPGDMTLEDLQNYSAVKQEAVCAPYRTYEVCSMAPPSSGGVTVLQILSLLAPFDLTGAGVHSVDALHLLFEASRLAYADRNQYLADNERLGAEGGLGTEQIIAGLLNPDYLQARASLIDSGAAAETVSAGDPTAYEAGPGVGKWKGLGADGSPEAPSTSHFVIVDAKGRVVSMTATVEFAFGSHLMAGGMILNNQLTDFSFVPERDGLPVANAVGPGKRPRSSMAPVIVFDENGEVWAALGSPGGAAIIGYVAKTLIALIDWNMSMQDAINLPNAVYPRGDAILEEDGFDAETVSALTAKGHSPTARALTSGVHGFRVLPNGSYDGGADTRREGTFATGVVED